MIDLIKRLRFGNTDSTTMNGAADLLEAHEKYIASLERIGADKDAAWREQLAAAKKTAYQTAVSDFCIQFGVKTVEELEHKIEAAHKEIVDLRVYVVEGDKALEAAQKEIEELKADRADAIKDWEEANEGYYQSDMKLAAAQAREVKYREALEISEIELEMQGCKDAPYSETERVNYEFVKAALAQPTDQSALDEAIRQAKVGVLREVFR